MCFTPNLLYALYELCFLCLPSYPLLNLPLPGNVPQHYASFSSNESRADAAPVWLSGSPVCYVQQVSSSVVICVIYILGNSDITLLLELLQVILKSAVSPWNDNLVLTDAFRGPLSEVFSLLENIRNYELENRYDFYIACE